MTLIASRYEIIDTVGAGGMGVVYRVYDKLRRQQVALKQVLLSDDAQRLAITREFRTLSTLRHPNIVSVIDYGAHDNQPYFTMEYLPDAQSLETYGDVGVGHIIQTLQALSYLHRRGILHRDLKPANVLLTADGVIKVLDFGLSTVISKGDVSQSTAGTLTYMAPEILQEGRPTVASDLWAIGVMLCEALTGHHPFDTSTSTNLLMSVITGTPTLSGMSAPLQAVVARLLAKDPTHRYATALEVIRDLCAATGIDYAAESVAQRESFLQAAAFVGRDAEYQQLVEALKITKNGANLFWLIGGEAGSGKSRLLDELRTQALVDGFMVLQGQAVEGGGLSYQLWREPARKLVIGAPMSDLTASVLKELVPDIATILAQSVADVPALEPKANRDRLMTALLERLKAQNSAVTIFLEDLHWGNESLDLLKLLAPRLTALQVMIVASYRNDEKPALPNQFPDAKLLTLERLTIEAVAELSHSMIGAENATPELVERLSLETEGNVLFMVEVVRALAEEAGSLYDISRKSLPDKIFSGGMVAVLQRRLSRVPTWALETLQLAAVLGRVINIPVLKAAGVNDIATWLQACADAAVLEPYNGEWRFSHDRLRQTVMNQATTLPRLHECAATALESVYPDNVGYFAALAHHWRIAGDVEREAQYIIKAADHLITISDDYGRAEQLLQRGLDLNLPHTRAELWLWSGILASKQGRLAESFTAFQNALDADPAPTLQALLLNRFGESCLRMGKHAEAEGYIQRAQAIAEHYNDQRNIGLSLNLLGIVSYYQGNPLEARAKFEQSLGIGRAIRHWHSISSSLNNLGNVTMAQGDFMAALQYLGESLSIERQMGNRSGAAGTLNNLSNASAALGDMAAARAYSEETLRIFREIGDKRGVSFSLESLGNLALQQGDIDTALETYQESLAICLEIGVVNISVYVEVGLGLVLLELGDTRQAWLHFTSALRNALTLNMPALMVLALLGAMYLIEGQDERQAQWLGVISERGGLKITQDWRFKRKMAELSVSLGQAKLDESVEQGKSLDLNTVIDSVLSELTAYLSLR